MEKWDIVCMRCGKRLFSEQRESIAGDIQRTNETNDEYYDEFKDIFYCTQCAQKMGYEV